MGGRTMRTTLIPILATALLVAGMVFQGSEGEPTLAEAPSVTLPDLGGWRRETSCATESELGVLPKDTQILRGRYVADDGSWFLVTAVIGGRSKSSIHRPELCLPSQGFQMRDPHTVEAGGTSWRMLRLDRQDVSVDFAYTFFNQEGFRTSSHVARIFRDVCDRSLRTQIDHWVMLTVNASTTDEASTTAFLEKLGGLLP